MGANRFNYNGMMAILRNLKFDISLTLEFMFVAFKILKYNVVKQPLEKIQENTTYIIFKVVGPRVYKNGLPSETSPHRFR
jgi:hypothetical protein